MIANLPPGVTEAMIPGNGLRDMAIDRWISEHYNDQVLFLEFLDRYGFGPVLRRYLEVSKQDVDRVLEAEPFGLRGHWDEFLAEKAADYLDAQPYDRKEDAE